LHGTWLIYGRKQSADSVEEGGRYKKNMEEEEMMAEGSCSYHYKIMDPPLVVGMNEKR
jgi:hypothetical protein